ncbi:hypothetical protein B1A_16709, partial [mine drainage metagenome]
ERSRIRRPGRSWKRSAPPLWKNGRLFPPPTGRSFRISRSPPNWKPATALYLEIAGESEEESGEASAGIGELLDRAASKVEALGGTVGRIQGSSLLFWFGISGLTEGAARRAARAALEIRRLVFGGPGEKSREIAFAAGIHSGRILRGRSVRPSGPDRIGVAVGHVAFDAGGPRIDSPVGTGGPSSQGPVPSFGSGRTPDP